MSLPRYEEYKDSGANWMGRVPARWRVARLKSLVSLVTEKASQRSRPIALENIESWSGRFVSTDGKFEGEGIAFQPGDLLFGKLRPYLAKAYLANSSGEAIGDFHVLRPSGKLVPRFLQYLILNKSFIDVIDGSTFGSKMPRASWDFLGSMPLALPSLEEQTSISAFLDRETAKIDALIAEQKNLIVLLAEKRLATISHSVTKGFNSNAPMKDSGATWLGNVPAHWEIRKISSLCSKITNGYVGPTRDILVDEGIKYLQSLHIKGGRILFSTPYFVKDEWSRAHQKSILAVGDVLIVQTGDIGQVAVVTDDFAGCNCHALIIVSPMRDVVGGEWLSLVLNSNFGFHSLLSIQTGALHPHLNCGNVKELCVPIPPLDEQRQLAEYIKAEVAKLEILCAEAERAVALLNERRAALIAAAVTGQIDVRTT